MGSNSSTAAPDGPSANPYSEAPRLLDKARFIVGGWRNALAPVVEKQIKAVIASMAIVPAPMLETLELGGTRMDYAFIKFKDQPGHTALSLGNEFKSRLFHGQFAAVGNTSKVLWAQPNRTLEARTWRKSINTVRRFLHTVRERAGLGLLYEEHGETTEVISGDYRANKRQVSWKGTVVCVFPAEGETKWEPETTLQAAFADIEGFGARDFLAKWSEFVAANVGTNEMAG